MAGKLPGSAIQSNTISITQIQTTAITSIVEQAGPRVTSLIYPGNDTAGNTVGGQTVYIVGSGFETNNAIYINGNAVPSKSFISASNLSFTTPALSAGIYPVYVINTDTGATAIFVPGYISSAEPTWVTGASLSDIGSTDPWSISLSATGDAPITYALADGSSLPNGITLAANGLISGTMSSPPESQTQYTFTVVASDAQNQDASRQFTVTVTTGEGVLFANNVLLIHADGTNNKNNHHFLDSSNNNLTITRAGNATQGSFSPFSQTGWSAYFDGNGDSLTYTGGSSINFGTSDFTIELYVNMANTGTFSAFLRPDDTGTFPEFGYDWSTSELKFQARDGAIASIATSFTPNAWRHVAVSRSGTSLRLFVDGTQVGSTITNSTNFGSPSNAIRIAGSSFSGTHSVNGYISNFRVVKGTALYTTTFTPPTSALTAVSGTSLLICQSNRFIDNSTNAYSITRNGDVSIQAFSPFAPTAAYSTANVGGSVYLDGTGDYLIVGASNLTASSTGKTSLAVGAGDFTIEGWFNTSTVSPSAAAIFKHYASSGTNDILEIRLVTNTVTVRYRVSGGVEAALTSGTITPEQWYHVAFVRNSGVVKGYLNGIEFGSASFTGNLVTTLSTTTIGCDQLGTSNFTGEISDFRFVKGTAVYTSAFTPPTAPLTNIANTSLLCNFTNAGIFDQTAKTVIETVGDAKVSTAQYKYGTGSIALDGTGDYLLTTPTQDLEFGSGNFTIEFWWYPTSTTRQGIIHGSFGTDWSYGIDYNGTGTNKIGIWASSSGSSWNLINADSGGNGIGTTTPTQNAWNHIAYVRNGTTWMLFVNGNRDLNLTGISGSIVNRATSRKAIGSWWSTGSMSQTYGYIDDLRITKGYARYTSNFTPPTSAFKDR